MENTNCWLGYRATETSWTDDRDAITRVAWGHCLATSTKVASHLTLSSVLLL